MATIKFYTAQKNTQDVIIYVSLSFGRQFRHRETTTFKVPKEFWIAKKSRVNVTRFHSGIKINEALAQIEKDLSDYVVQVSTFKEELSVPKVKAIISNIVNKNSKNDGFVQFAEKYIDDNYKDWTGSKLRVYRGMLKLVANYADSVNAVVNFNDINLVFFDALKSYAFSTGLSHNTFATYISVFKKVLEYADLAGLIKKNPSKSFKVNRLQADRALLTDEEVDAIYKVTCKTKKMAYVRDLAILEADTALRISDVSRLHVRENLVHKNDRWYVEILPKKTTNSKRKIHRAFVPLSDRAYEIIKRYEKFKPVPSDTYALNIKKICQKAGICEEISVFKNMGGKNVEVRAPKYEFIQSHTFRHYAITKMLSMKIPPHVIGGMIGINATTVATYTHLDSSDYADMAVEYGL